MTEIQLTGPPETGNLTFDSWCQHFAEIVRRELIIEGQIQGASNLGSGDGIYDSVASHTLRFKSLTAGTAITIKTSSTEIEIACDISEVTDHGHLTGLSDDDHSQYLLCNGSRPLTGGWDAGDYDIKAGNIIMRANRFVGQSSGPQIKFDDTNNFLEITGGNVSIGGTGAATQHFRIIDNALTIDGSYLAVYSTHIKTAGTSGIFDTFQGRSDQISMNQSGGTIGKLKGTSCEITLSDGTVSSELTVAELTADIDGGTVSGSIYGLKTDLDIEAGVTSIGGSVYGHRIAVDADKDPTGSVYMLYLDEGNNIDYGIYQNGTADNYFGGKVGIGTGSPSTELEVNGDITVGDNDWIGLASDDLRIQFDNNNSELAATSCCTDPDDDQDNTDGWTAGNATLTSEAGGVTGFRLKAAATASRGYAKTANISMAAGKLYSLKVKAGADVGDKYRVLLYSATYGESSYDSGVAGTAGTGAGNWDTVDVAIKCPSTQTDWILYLYAFNNGDNAYFDNVSLEQLDLISVVGGGFNVGEGSISAATLTITASADDTDVSGVNTVFIDASNAAIVIGGFTGGVVGQVLLVAIIDSTNNITLEHAEGTVNQDIILCDELDDVLDDYGGWTLVCNGSEWYDCGHAKHV